MNRNDGGYAFPSRNEWDYNGLSLRDYFAAKAMLGLMSSPLWTNSVEKIAEFAYLQADAMLAERAK